MQKLVEGIHRFQSESFSQDQKLFETLAEGQNPLALFITCSDSSSGWYAYASRVDQATGDAVFRPMKGFATALP